MGSLDSQQLRRDHRRSVIRRVTRADFGDRRIRFGEFAMSEEKNRACQERVSNHMVRLSYRSFTGPCCHAECRPSHIRVVVDEAAGRSTRIGTTITCE